MFASDFFIKTVHPSSNVCVTTPGLLKTHAVTGTFHLAMSSDQSTFTDSELQTLTHRRHGLSAQVGPLVYWSEEIYD